MNHHIEGPECPLCNQKLETAHPVWKFWYAGIKTNFPDCHISWAFRSENEQNDFVKQGKSRACWPSSAHNHEEDGKPCSLALDLFQIGADKVARFNPGYYFKISQFLDKQKSPIEWSGTWKGFIETNHYQIKKDSTPC